MLRIIPITCLLLLASACSDGGGGAEPDVDAPADVAGDEVEVTPDAVDADGATGARCCPTGVCGLGEICLEGSCHPVPGENGCYADGECAAGQQCEGASFCPCDDPDCEPEVGTCRWPEGCCNTDSECPGDAVCHQGVCRDVPEGAGCWADAHCKAGRVCDGVESCPCGAEGCEASPGFCSLPGMCCLSDDECGPDGLCVGERCVPAPEEDHCFSGDDCDGATRCVGAYVCPCGDDTCLVPTTPGVCTAEEEVCCDNPADCSETAVCVEGRACLDVPGGGECWVDEHCGPGRVCEDATVCTCGELCPTGSSVPGSCHTQTTACSDDADCAAGMRCAIPDTAWCPDAPAPTEGVCVEQVDEGCWSRDDCATGERCSDEQVCTDPAGCDEPNRPGRCVPLADQDHCCDSHRECGPGLECRNSNTTMTCPPNSTASCVSEPVFGETCWNFEDCPEGLVCNGHRLLGCGSLFQKSKNGFCESPEGMPCKTGIDCGDGFTCARDEDCPVMPSECGTGSNCPTSGLCQQKVAGRCWTHSACADDEYCEGLRVCPADTACADPDEPGTCEPLGQAGDCCDSYHGCAPGLRCISAVDMEACDLDLSSVCVPRIDPFDDVSCFTDADCDSAARHCVGAQVCPCGISDCEGPPQAGSCELKQP
ncbi:MAG: hypothetical protein ACQEXJ_23260 [Myxococcota bacterium]